MNRKAFSAALGAAGGLLLAAILILGPTGIVTGSIGTRPVEVAFAVVLFTIYVGLTYRIEVMADD